jgi:hypothetical protein
MPIKPFGLREGGNRKRKTVFSPYERVKKENCTKQERQAK